MIEGVSAVRATKSGSDLAGSSGVNSATSADGADFGHVFGQVVNDAIGTLQAGEATAIQGIEGSASPFKVVEAVMGAQRALQSALSIRDKAVSAYQEISRMAI
jgi:flagellar hook-basal body complex protein FliE